MTELQVRQVECKNCGAKIDIHTGLRMKTFTCEYCGSICDNEQVVAIQNQQELKEKFAPRSFLKLGLKGKFLGREYQIVGRIRVEATDYEETWDWDEWFMMSPTGYPLWIQEDEEGYTLLRRHVADSFIEPDPGYIPHTSTIVADKTVFYFKEYGISKLVFIEGELTWAARPGEETSYMDFYSGNRVFSIESAQNEIQYFLGQKLSPAELKDAFGDVVPELSSLPVSASKPNKGLPWLFIGLLMISVGAFSWLLSISVRNSGSFVFGGKAYIPLHGTVEKEFSFNMGGKPEVFEIKKGPVVAFKFKSGDFSYGASSSEAGWWVSLSLYKKTDKGDKLTAVINADFWKANGYDDGYWSESKKSDTKYIKLAKGKYYFKIYAAANHTNGTRYAQNVQLKVEVIDGVWNPSPFKTFAWILLILGGIIVAIKIFMGFSDAEDSNQFSTVTNPDDMSSYYTP